MSAPIKAGYVKPLDLRRGCVDLSHGGGGRAMQQLIAELFTRHLHNPFLAQGNDGTCVPVEAGSLVVSTDSHVVSPLFFPGGDIGCLAVHGTVNDVAMMGAVPRYLTAGFILEEGFPLSDLERIIQSMAQAAQEAGVQVVAGDTKVVEAGKGDGLYITTTGVGFVPEGRRLSGHLARVGDAILVSGTVGDHGMAIMSQRENLRFETPLRSDTAALNHLIQKLLAGEEGVRVLRDPTRGGVAATLNEIAHQSAVGMLLEEAAIPLRPEVEASCELLGLDPLNVANEGKVIVICAPESAQRLLQVMRQDPLGQEAAQIGEVIQDEHCFVQMTTRMGGRRMVDWLSGEQLPRIC